MIEYARARSNRVLHYRELIKLTRATLAYAESVLRCALLKQHRQLSYEELAFHLEDSASFRAFARLPLWAGDPICQVAFHWLDEATDRPYRGQVPEPGREADACDLRGQVKAWRLWTDTRLRKSFVMNSVVQFLKRLAQILFYLVVVVFLGSLLIGVGSLIAALRSPSENVEKPSILALDLDGIIVDTRDIVESLRKYRTENRIKGVLLRINSPGGVVGPSSGTLGRAETHARGIQEACRRLLQRSCGERRILCRCRGRQDRDDARLSDRLDWCADGIRKFGQTL